MKLATLARLLLPMALRYAERHKPNFKVGGEENPYLVRWYLIPRNKYFNVYLHNMLRDDDDVLHDHPWWSLSLALTDGLCEFYQPKPHKVHPDVCKMVRFIYQGSVIFRSSRFAHQLVLAKPAWTIFITGPVLRDWGFWCPKGFRHFKDYVAVKDGVSKVGRGCGEMN